jgi:hypothetical protein
MKRKTVILLTAPGITEVWGSFLAMCQAHGFSYNYLKRKPLPTEYRGFRIERHTIL